MERVSPVSLEFVKFDGEAGRPGPVEFKQSVADTLGMSEIFGKLQLSITADEDTIEKVGQLSKEFNTINPMKNKDILYLKLKAISNKQKKEIFNKGPMTVKIKFSCIGYYTNVEDGERYLSFKVNGLGKSEDQSSFAPVD